MRLPEFVKPARGASAERHRVKSLLRGQGLHTVCESARCPNIGECFGGSTATFLILGDTCTRSCAFCAVKHGSPAPINPDEPRKLAEAAATLQLKHVVITSVTRDDLPDGGATHFAKSIEEVRKSLPNAVVEVLIPDFGGDNESLHIVISASPNVLNHNVETVPQLYPEVRPQADYHRSIELIARASRSTLKTKSGLMLGMGEEHDEVIEVMKDLRNAGCDMLTLGQYLRPTRRNRAVVKYVEPAEFEVFRAQALKLGFSSVASAPLVRSSYRADKM